MKKRVFWALGLGVLSLACLAFYEISPELHFIYGLRIVFADPDPAHPKDFEAAIRHFKAIPEGFWVHEVAPAYLLAIEAQRDKPEDFQSLTPEQHYLAAIYVCQHAPVLPGEFTPFDIDCLLKSPQDFTRAIRHLETIPKDSPVYADAVRTLRLIKMQRDRPQDFEAARAADNQQCVATVGAGFGPGTCGNAIDGECDLFNLTRANNTVSATYKPPPSKYHYTEEEIVRRAKAASQRKP